MKNIIVYGSRFGQFYLEALKRMEGIKIVGLLAKGSDRSYECARYYNIPLYTSLDEVEERVDVACVAVKTGALGGEGANIAKQLLRKGINVLLEQPVHYKELGECYKIAQNQKVYFGVGNLYLNLPAVQNFIRNVHIVSKTEKIAYINVDLATQVSYPVISILGEVLQTLRPSVLSALQGKGYALLIGARNQYKLQCLKEEFSTENIEIIQMDVFIPKQVEMFCSQCDVVINCTSPASIVGTRIVRECIKQGNDYIDPFGEGDVEKYIVDNKSMIGNKKTRIILSSGTYPGLSEALFKYVAEIHKGAEVSIKEYFYGNSYFSHGATQDVISSMINNKSKSMSFFYKDEIIPCKMRIGESICIDEKVGTMYLYPIISKDFRRVCKETGVKEGCFFNTFSDLSSMASFFEIGSKIYHSNSMDTFGYTEQLEKMYRNKSTENEKTIFWFGIELVNGNDVEKKLMSFEYACNWNSLSGYVCALVAEWCLNDEISKGKAYNLDEIEGIQKFIESLPGEIKQNIVKL